MRTFTIPAEKLEDVVLGRDRTYERAEAMAQLAATERPGRESILARVLENDEEPRRYKAPAAVALGRIATPVSEKILLSRLTRLSDPAFPELLLALGHIGGRDALTAIDALKLPAGHPGNRVAAYSASLIAHRLGLPGHDDPFPPESEILPAPTTQTRPVEFRAVDAAMAKSVLDDLRDFPYGIRFDAAKLTQFQCGGETNVVCPNSDFLATSAERLRQRKAILALCALQSPETGEYSVSYVVFARPTSAAAGTLAITIHRCSGKLALAGTAHVAGMRIDFTLRTVRQPGAWAASIKGAMVDGRMEIAEAKSSTVPEKRRTPALRPMPAL